MRNMLGLLGLGSALVALAPSANAQGADRCSDILRDGTLKIEALKDNQYYQQVQASREIRSSASDRQRQWSGGVTVPVYGVPVTASGGSSNRDTASSASDTSRFSLISEKHEVDAFLSTGDSVIVDAWKGCMTRSGGGLTLWFTTNNARNAILHISWLPGIVGEPAGYEDAHLVEDYRLPEGVEVISGQHCLLASNRISKGDCQVALRLESATQDLEVSFNTDRNVAASAYLPPRLVYDTDGSMPFTFSAADMAKGGVNVNAGYDPQPVTRTVHLSQAQIADGWRFDPSSVRFTVRKTYGGPHHRCRSAKVDETGPFQIAYSYIADRSAEDHDDRGTSLTCIGQPSARIIRHRWVPMPG